MPGASGMREIEDTGHNGITLFGVRRQILLSNFTVAF